MRDAGIIGFVPRGEYSDTETYDFLQFVYYKGSAYVAKKETTGNEPEENNEFWQILAKGEVGNYLPIDGTAKNSEKLAGYEITKVSSKIWGSIPRIDASGVMEVGKYIDFHSSADDFTDFYIRITARDGGLYIGDKKIVVAGEALPITGGTLESSNSPILKLKRVGANSTRMQFEGVDGYEVTIGGFISKERGKVFEVFDENTDASVNKYFLQVGDSVRNIYDYKTNSNKQIVVEGEVLPISGGTLTQKTMYGSILKLTSENENSDISLDLIPTNCPTCIRLQANSRVDGAIFEIYDIEAGGKATELFSVSRNGRRIIYNKETNSMQKILVEGEALPITGGKLTNNKEMILTLNNTSENATQTSLCFQHNTISAGLIIVDNDGSIHYWDYVHGKTLFWIGVNKREIYDSASGSRKKIMVDGDVSHFQAGEAFRIKGDTPLAGYVTTGATAIFFTIPLPKSAEGRTVKISCNPWRVRGVQGYIVNQVNMDDYSVATEISGNLLKLQVRKKDLTAFDNAVNNTPVGVDGNFTIEFS